MSACMAVFLLQDTVQTVQALKGASSQMRGAMKHNKELDLNFIDNLQVGTAQHMPCQLRVAAATVCHRPYAAGCSSRVQPKICNTLPQANAHWYQATANWHMGTSGSSGVGN